MFGRDSVIDREHSHLGDRRDRHGLVGSQYRTYAPERLSDVEIGLKSQFSLGNVDVRANLAAYRGI